MNSIKSWKTLDCKHVIASAVYSRTAAYHCHILQVGILTPLNS